MFFFQQSSSQLTDVTILGAGGAGTSTLISTIEELKRKHPNGMPQPMVITILERSQEIYGGFPYNPAIQNPILRVNEPNSDMMLDIDNSNDFVQWLKDNSEDLKKKYPHLAQTIDDNNSGTDPNAPRMLFGVYCNQRLNDYVELAKKLNITVNVETGVNIVDAIQDYDENWYLKSEDNRTYPTKNLIIATGHMPAEDRFKKISSMKGYYHTPYQDLTNVPDEPVFILGSALSAIDTSKILVSQNIKSPIYMISPSGQLPTVKGPSGGASYQIKFLTAENLAKPNLRLSEILELFTKEVRNATGDDSWTIDSLLATAKNYHADVKKSLHEEIDIIEHKQVRMWQLMLGQVWTDPIALIWEYIDERDRNDLTKVYFPLFQKWAAGMTFANAKQLADLLDKGQLHLISSRNEVTYNEDTKKFELKLNDQEIISAATVINATGTGENIKKNASLHAMTKRGLIEQAQYFGGLHLTPNLQVITSGNKIQNNAWGVGYISVGSNIGASGMEQAAHDAKKIALQLVDNLLQSKKDYRPRVKGQNKN